MLSVLKTDILTRSKAVLFIAQGTGIPPVCTALPFLLFLLEVPSRAGQSVLPRKPLRSFSVLCPFPPVATLS